MLILSLSTVIQEAVAETGLKKLSGNIRSLDELLKPENLAILDERHTGLFAFLAFHPGVDEAVASYVRGGSLASDAGPDTLVLFMLDAEARSAAPLSDNAFGSWLALDTSIHPAYQLVRWLVEPKAPPALPGIVFFKRFTQPDEAVYVSLHGLADAKAVGEQLRNVFSIAERSLRSERQSFAARFAVELQQRKLKYQRSGSTSLREWLVRAYQLAGEHAGDIVSVLGLFA
jgi:hypothetical protein